MAPAFTVKVKGTPCPNFSVQSLRAFAGGMPVNSFWLITVRPSLFATSGFHSSTLYSTTPFTRFSAPVSTMTDAAPGSSSSSYPRDASAGRATSIRSVRNAPVDTELILTLHPDSARTITNAPISQCDLLTMYSSPAPAWSHANDHT